MKDPLKISITHRGRYVEIFVFRMGTRRITWAWNRDCECSLRKQPCDVPEHIDELRLYLLFCSIGLRWWQ